MGLFDVDVLDHPIFKPGMLVKIIPDSKPNSWYNRNGYSGMILRVVEAYRHGGELLIHTNYVGRVGEGLEMAEGYRLNIHPHLLVPCEMNNRGNIHLLKEMK